MVDEEGIGLRMNLSIRGLDPDRSRSILVLEDGMPAALAPRMGNLKCIILR